MSFTNLLVLALVVSIFCLFISKALIQQNPKQQSVWWAGSKLLFVNAVIITATVCGVFKLPVPVPLVMVGSPFASVLVWTFFRAGFTAPFWGRAYAFLIGHSVYGVLLVYFLYKNTTLTPLYPGEDLFMRGLGYLGGIGICFFAILIGAAVFLAPDKFWRR
ncbi:hypothetical protein [Bacillus testis]|uniref:hypothetical protein n=1 Tax=Bacillus testis TaxID=1622072 RepID=UPI00067ED996|nr:hypothetical protein [Bacillus testis]